MHFSLLRMHCVCKYPQSIFRLANQPSDDTSQSNAISHTPLTVLPPTGMDCVSVYSAVGPDPPGAGMGYVWCQHWLPWWRQAYIRRLNSLRTVGINPLSPGASVILLTNCGLVTPYDDIDLCQHWLRWRLFAWQHQAITWTSVDLPSVSNHLRAFFIRDTSTIN